MQRRILLLSAVNPCVHMMRQLRYEELSSCVRHLQSVNVTARTSVRW